MQIQPLRTIIMERVSIGSEVSTAELIRMHTGEFKSDKGVSAAKSANANFGRFVSNNETSLGLQRVRSGVRTHDDDGNATKTAIWKRVT